MTKHCLTLASIPAEQTAHTKTSVQVSTFVEMGQEDRREILRKHLVGNVLNTFSTLFSVFSIGINIAFGNYAAALVILFIVFGFNVIWHLRSLRKHQRELDEFDSEQETRSRSVAALRLGWPGDLSIVGPHEPHEQYDQPARGAVAVTFGGFVKFEIPQEGSLTTDGIRVFLDGLEITRAPAEHHECQTCAKVTECQTCIACAHAGPCGTCDM